MPAQPKTRPKKSIKPRKASPKTKKRPGLECSVCGYRVVVDESCGCVEEHILVCCGRPMAKT